MSDLMRHFTSFILFSFLLFIVSFYILLLAFIAFWIFAQALHVKHTHTCYTPVECVPHQFLKRSKWTLNIGMEDDNNSSNGKIINNFNRENIIQNTKKQISICLYVSGKCAWISHERVHCTCENRACKNNDNNHMTLTTK